MFGGLILGFLVGFLLSYINWILYLLSHKVIKFNNLSNQSPYLIFKDRYDESLKAGQKNIEAIAISSYNKGNAEVESRFVNLKFVEGDEFIFFSNYNSPKSVAFKGHDQISALIYWGSINVQIRIKATKTKK